ncbi:hypothetical protein KAR91_50155 [Candidatus Pacearchaeota archaeon]|nr:hypothetical protein [Candidatus Pacearchaeota archaeon]
MAKSKQQYFNEAVAAGKEIPASVAAKLTEKDLIKLIKDLWVFRQAEGFRTLSRGYFRSRTGVKDALWEKYFGTFPAFQRSAGITATRGQRKLANDIAKHKDADLYRQLNAERATWADRFLKPTSGRIKTYIAASDFHDKECDPFCLRVFLDTIARIRKAQQLAGVILGGDAFDLPEFGRFVVDPRTWDAAGRIKFVHDEILAPTRKAAGSETQIDFIEGNHELRLVKHMCNTDPATMNILADLHGMGVREMLGLDKFEINYIGKADLTAWNKGDEANQVARSFKIYDDAFLVHHEPQGRNIAGMPGINGHHHHHLVWHDYNVNRGSYEWHQIGSMHYRDASYCDGEKWSNGFIIIHVDTETKQVVFNYVDVRDFAEVGGKFYVRGKDEHNLG